MKELKKTKSGSSKVRISPSELFLKKMKFYTSLFYDREFSGVIFLKRNPKSRVSFNKDNYEIVDFILEDIGSETYTGSDRAKLNTANEYVDAMLNEGKMEYLEYTRATLHSHHNMNVSFSNTDFEDLEKLSATANYYISIIVYNDMSFEGYMGYYSKVIYRSRTEEVVEDEGEVKSLRKTREPLIKRVFNKTPLKFNKYNPDVDPYGDFTPEELGIIGRVIEKDLPKNSYSIRQADHNTSDIKWDFPHQKNSNNSLLKHKSC